MEVIENFLKIDEFPSGDGSGDGSGYGNVDGDGYGNGYGDGYGNVSGSGNGYGSGYGNGYGDGSGNGDGSGDGSGNGDGSGLKSLNNKKIYIIDSIQTIIESVKNNVSKGFIVNSDLSLSPCFIAKGENKFSHGETLSKAVQSLQDKLLLDTPIEQRMEKFFVEFPSKEKKYEASKFYDWHFYLTGSCKLGRDSFVKDKGIDLEKDSFTISEFIDLVQNSYGSEVIHELKKQLLTD